MKPLVVHFMCRGAGRMRPAIGRPTRVPRRAQGVQGTQECTNSARANIYRTYGCNML